MKQKSQRAAEIQLPYPSGGALTKVFWIITDIHHLSNSLYRENEGSFSFLRQHNPGKLFEATKDVLEEFRDLSLLFRPDAVLVPGDLTLNGEWASLQETAELFAFLEENGIRVCIIPGNHDMDCRFSLSFLEDTPRPAEAISGEQFEQTIGRFGWNSAFSKAPDSFSYVLSPDKTLWLLSLDANTKENPCALSEATLAWAESVLQKAEENRVNVISMSHQNVLVQNPHMIQGFRLRNGEEVTQLLKRHSVALNLSGHSHLQHISQSGCLYDICTGAACVWPLGYAVLTVNTESGLCRYETRDFRCHQEEALRRIDEVTEKMIGSSSFAEGCEEAEKTEMIRFAKEVARMEFSGLLDDPATYRRMEGWALWTQYGRAHPMYARMVSCLETEDSDFSET